jgi:sulfite reductase (ferredoxin)
VFAHLDHLGLDLDDLGEVNIRISGCPNGCANHWSADLGFYGKVRRVKGRPVPTYNVVGGGGVCEGVVHMAEQAGWVHARDLPQFLGQVLERYAAFKTAAAEPTDFGRFWRSQGRAYIADLCADRYNHIPAFEENRQYYYDHGSTEIFSTRNISAQAECSAGIYDMIAVDEKAVRANLQQISAWSGEPAAFDALLRETLFFSARMLLVTRGQEAFTEEDTYALFIQHFIDRRLIADTHRSVVQRGLDAEAALTPHADAVVALAAAILDLCSRMEDTMRFPGEGPQDAQAESKRIAKPDFGSQRRYEPDRFKDLRGVKCPINFAQTKIQLAAMQSGQVLKIYLDDGEPINNVPGSVKLEGHDVIEQIKVDEYWSVLIRKA